MAGAAHGSQGYTPPDESSDDGPRRKKAKKDPNAPKRAQNAYMFFVNEFRETVKAEGGPTKPTEVGKLAGEKWRAMSAEEKKVRHACALRKGCHARHMMRHDRVPAPLHCRTLAWRFRTFFIIYLLVVSQVPTSLCGLKLTRLAVRG